MAQLSKPIITGGHWYSPDGNPRHTVPYAGKREGERATTLSDARKLGLLPSVTGVMGVLAAPGLENWKMDMLLDHASRNPWSELDEPLEYWKKRVRDGAFQKNIAVMDLGSRIHTALETEEVPDDLKQYVEPVFAKLVEEGIIQTQREIVLANPQEGFAGRTDALIVRNGALKGVLDFKSKGTKKDEPIRAYSNHGMQLAAYGATAYGREALGNLCLVNVFVSTTEPGRVECIYHAPDSQARYYETFLHCCAIWRVVNNYDPRTK